MKVEFRVEANATMAESIAIQVVVGLLWDRQSNTRWCSTIRPPKFYGFPHECPCKFLARIGLIAAALNDSERQPVVIARQHCCLGLAI